MKRPLLLALATTVAACASAPKPGTEAPATTTPGAFGGFVVYVRDMPRRYRSVVIPTHPHNETLATTLDGLWLYEDADEHLGVAAPTSCACQDVCDKVPSLPWTEPDIIHTDAAECHHPGWESLVGGRLYSQSEYEITACEDGADSAPIESMSFALGTAESRFGAFSDDEAAFRFCKPQVHVDEDGAEVDYPACLPDVSGDATSLSADCGVCLERDYWESEIPIIRSGLLAARRSSRTANVEGPEELIAWRLSEADCPSAHDTCGDLRTFKHVPVVARASLPAAGFEGRMTVPFWINTKSTFALVEQTAGAWVIHAREGADNPRPPAELSGVTANMTADAPHVIGVRWHDDLRPLLTRACAATCNAPQTPDGEDADELETATNACEIMFDLFGACVPHDVDDMCADVDADE